MSWAKQDWNASHRAIADLSGSNAEICEGVHERKGRYELEVLLGSQIRCFPLELIEELIAAHKKDLA